MDTIRLYLHSMRMLIRSQLEYPASFALQTLAQLVMEGGEMMAVILLVNRFEHLNRWEAGDLYFFFGLMSVTFYLTECFGRGITGNFPSLIRRGQLDTYLARPRGLLTQVLCSAADPRRIACIAVGVAALAMGCGMSRVQWSIQKALLFTEAVACGCFLILGLITKAITEDPPVTIREGEVPVFWPCGVTPQNVVMQSKPDFVITHAPGHMLITDVKNVNLKY